MIPKLGLAQNLKVFSLALAHVRIHGSLRQRATKWLTIGRQGVRSGDVRTPGW